MFIGMVDGNRKVPVYAVVNALRMLELLCVIRT